MVLGPATARAATRAWAHNIYGAAREGTDVSLLRDLYVWAYERSCAQFKVLRESMGDPDPIRLNYRTQLRTLVADVVRGLEWPSVEQVIRHVKRVGVPDQDVEAVASEARQELRALRPEFLARYALRQREYDAWVQEVASARRD